MGRQVPARFVVSDDNSERVSLRFEFSASGGGFQPATPGVESDRLTDLPAPSVEADFRAVFGWLGRRGAPKIGALGFCLGGRLSFIANSALPLDAAVSFYGGRMDEYLDRAGRLHGPHFFLWGGQDPIIPEEQRRRVMDVVREAGRSYVELTFGDADHGFFCDQRASYHPPSAQVAWVALLAFLRDRLG